MRSEYCSMGVCHTHVSTEVLLFQVGAGLFILFPCLLSIFSVWGFSRHNKHTAARQRRDTRWIMNSIKPPPLPLCCAILHTAVRIKTGTPPTPPTHIVDLSIVYHRFAPRDVVLQHPELALPLLARFLLGVGHRSQKYTQKKTPTNFQLSPSRVCAPGCASLSFPVGPVSQAGGAFLCNRITCFPRPHHSGLDQLVSVGGGGGGGLVLGAWWLCCPGGGFALFGWAFGFRTCKGARDASEPHSHTISVVNLTSQRCGVDHTRARLLCRGAEGEVVVWWCGHSQLCKSAFVGEPTPAVGVLRDTRGEITSCEARKRERERDRERGRCELARDTEAGKQK